ncbi:MAG: molecular chaperone HtpG [Spirochaetia bacterium]|nr:molecular chaperone HtpG [Spirochaetia bacterium]
MDKEKNKNVSKEEKNTGNAQEFAFEAEMDQLMHLIIHSLYTHKEIFMRELISNASDALQKIRFIELTNTEILGAGEELKINIEMDEKKNQLIIRDNGIGMSEDELKANIGTIAKSGTLKFLKEAAAKNEKKENMDLIGQFGVGFYSVFMVAEEVRVRTKSVHPSEKAVEWKSKGTGKYTITPIEKADRGTEIIIQLKSEDKEYTGQYQVKNIIQKYSNFVEFPIYLGEEHVNKSSALWRKKPSEVKPEDLNEFYKFISHDFNDPLGHIQVNAEAPLTYSGLLFIPEKSTGDIFQKPDDFHVHLYVKKVFIQNDCKDLLPPYLRFLRGVVDSEDLPLNVSREVTQHSAVLGKIKKALTSKILKLLEGWAENDKEKYLKFYKNFSSIMKEGVESDYENKDKLISLLRFKTSALNDGEFTSFSEYVSRLKPGQDKIYYIAGRNLDALKSNPNIEYFANQGFEVLYITDMIDEYLMPVIGKYQDMEIIHVEKAEVKAPENDNSEKIDETVKKDFIGRIKDILSDKIDEVKESNRLVSSPCSLVSNKGALNPHMEQMMKMMDPNYKSAKKNMEINLSHPLVKKLIAIHEREPKSQELESTVNTIFEALLLLEDKLDNPNKLVEKLFSYMDQSLV